MLYERHNFLNKNIPYLVSRDIVEYDIQSAGLNLMKYFHLIDDATITHLESLDKKHRVVEIGLLQRKNKELVKLLNEKFVEIRRMFFDANHIKDDEVLAIKKDAIITLRRCTECQFGNVIFVEKNVYTSYFNMNGCEFYVGEDVLDVKGISDDKLRHHKQYMLDFLYSIFKMMETTSTKRVAKNIKDFADYYKSRALDIGYYRELNQESMFRTNEIWNDKPLYIEDPGDVNLLNIGYNYIRYVIPLINLNI